MKSVFRYDHRVAVIIPTFRGEEKIKSLLLALQHQSFDDFKVIVSIDELGSNLEQRLSAEKYQLKHPIAFYEHSNLGRAGNRNFAFLRSDAELIIFFDDDMRPEPDCIENHVSHHSHIKSSILVGRQVEDLKISNDDFFQFKGYLSRKWEQKLKKGKLDVPYITAANFSIGRKVFEQLGGFDESLSDAEDYELAVRAKKVGVPIYYDPDCMAWHDDFITLSDYKRRQKLYATANSRVRFMHTVPAHTTKMHFLRRLLLKILNADIFIRMAEIGIFKMFPRKARFKIYSVLVSTEAIFIK